VFLLCGTDWINFIYLAMCQEVSTRPVTAETEVRFQTRYFKICGWPSGPVTGFPPSDSVSPAIIIPPLLHNYLRTSVSLNRRTSRRSLGKLQKNNAVSEIGKNW
jgi:hypothetical protein